MHVIVLFFLPRGHGSALDDQQISVTMSTSIGCVVMELPPSMPCSAKCSRVYRWTFVLSMNSSENCRLIDPCWNNCCSCVWSQIQMIIVDGYYVGAIGGLKGLMHDDMDKCNIVFTARWIPHDGILDFKVRVQQVQPGSTNMALP